MKFKILIISAAITTLLFLATINANAATIDKHGSAGQEVISINNQYPETLPQKYSSFDLGECTSVKSQKNNDCWIYSTLGTFESLLLHNNLFTLDLSTEHMDKWATTNNNGEGWLRSIGDAGFSYTSIGYLSSWSGPVLNNLASCKIGATGIEYLSKENTDSIKRLIMKSGAVVGNLNYYNKGASSDNTSFCVNKKTSTIDGHSISVVGWDDNYNKDNFDGNYRPESNGAWLCKNSWGNYNSLKGYFWVSYNDYYLFNSEVFGPSFGIKTYQTINKDIHLYQNEIYGATYEFNYEKNKSNTYMNVFDFSDDGNILDKIIFETTSVGADYTLYYVPLDNDIPVRNKKDWINLGSGKVNYSGYICNDVDDIVIPNKKGAIAVVIDTSNCNSNIYSSIGVDEWLYNSSGDLIFIDTLKNKTSFLIYENKIVDLKQYYINKNNDEIGGTFVIKAVTNGKADYKLPGDVNKDGYINVMDATLIQKYLVDISTLSDEQLALADFNVDNSININDATAIQKHIAY